MKHSLKRLCGTGALVLPLSVWAQPAVEDLTAQSNSLYSQTAVQQEPSGGGNLALFNQLQDNQRDIKRLRGQIEELRYQLEQQKKLSQERYLNLEKRLEAMASRPPEASVDSDAAQSVTGASADNGSSSNQAGIQGRDAYQAAFQKVQARDFDAAIQAFQDFITAYPNSDLRPNAHYWLGELYSAQSQLDAAAQAFQTVIDDYPDSNKVADALYKLGLLKARQGHPDESKNLLNRVRNDYPDSNAADMAQDFLNQSGT
ncbi:tol-pal system protein YbgF [Chromohalobacter marismortui]|uniref:Cell division coordinator CpoB n=1 Tax=Chromohalobacter marismortui TaxID=42055 RepID=A0A4R7NPL6_9GAMM|nr:MULTISPECIES: tol-pal system protein YbgF [Chromohalobacter]MCI0508957.1 tol-pal system protein YbgF [Chromohalobacter sp.]MCI0592313.1 tol-pal system protein YbgF [Chromohalobacter sp.]TDU22668.1 tol-pal system protein YbgF [Chromohalobacter marismortui]